MARICQCLFVSALLACCWLGMMGVHELGHVVGAWSTGGKVTRVVLHPLTISRTDVSPNPHPAITVWAGPLLGMLLPMGLAASFRRSNAAGPLTLSFFAGFCLIANGGYLFADSFERMADAGQMYQNGTPLWVIRAVGLAAVTLGLIYWHRLGSLPAFWRNPATVSWRLCLLCVASLALILAAGICLSPRS